MNDVFLKGNLTRDPEVKEITYGSGKTTHVATFTLAITRFFKRSSGEKEKETIFVPCEAWDTGAETIGKYVKKGNPLLIKGSLKMDSWETAEGDKRSRMLVRVSNFDLLYGPPKNGSGVKDNNADDADDAGDANNGGPKDSPSETNEPF